MTTEEILAALDRRREELGLTWQKAALLAEVNPATVHGWVRKARQPNLYNLIKVCDALGLDVRVERKRGG